VGEEPRHARVHFLSTARNARGEFVGARREILGDVIQDLGAHVSGAAPPGVRGVRRFDGVADVLTIAFRDFAQHASVGPVDLATVPLVRSSLLPSDEKFVCPINGRERCRLRIGNCRLRIGRVRLRHRPGINPQSGIRNWRYSYIPSLPPSRPNPDSRYPPNPAAASNRFVQLIQTTPALIFGATSSARLMFSV